MRKLVTSTFVTMDSVMQAPGGPTEDESGGFTSGGWLVPYFDDIVGQAMGDIFAKQPALEVVTAVLVLRDLATMAQAGELVLVCLARLTWHSVASYNTCNVYCSKYVVELLLIA